MDQADFPNIFFVPLEILLSYCLPIAGNVSYSVTKLLEGNIEMDLQEVRGGGMDWIDFAQDKDR